MAFDGLHKAKIHLKMKSQKEFALLTRTHHLVIAEVILATGNPKKVESVFEKIIAKTICWSIFYLFRDIAASYSLLSICK